MEDFTENSIELEDTREEYKNELIMLHASLKALNSALDFVEQTLDEDNWINCACWVQPARCFRKYGCIQGLAEVAGTIAMQVSISGHWNGISDFPETIP